jgi:V/A-type H+-transporting ATPase subunit K
MRSIKQRFYIRVFLLQLVFAAIVVIAVTSLMGSVRATPESGGSNPGFYGIDAIAAALAIGLSAIGAGLALKTAATAAISAITERESLLGKALVLVALCEALAIYGLIVALMLMNYLAM